MYAMTSERFGVGVGVGVEASVVTCDACEMKIGLVYGLSHIAMSIEADISIVVFI